MVRLLPFFLLAPLAAGGCAEVVRGPRVVTVSEDRFYIRHVPVIDSREDVDLLAGAICEGTGRVAGLESAEQFALLDIRYAVYRCVEVFTPADGGDRPPEEEQGA